MSLTFKKPAEGLFQRFYNIAKIIDSLPDDMSDEEVEGLLKALPDDLANTAQAVLMPRIRRAGILFLKNI
jgi:hypothetical protein